MALVCFYYSIFKKKRKTTPQLPKDSFIMQSYAQKAKKLVIMVVAVLFANKEETV